MFGKHKLLKGTSISTGIVLGHARVVTPGVPDVAEISVPSSRIKAEINALEKAVEATVNELKTLRKSAGKKMGSSVAKIFDAQLMIATDTEFLKQVRDEISNQKRNASFVYHSLVSKTIIPLDNSPEPYIRQMAQDIEAVASRILSRLTGDEKGKLYFAPNTILVGKFFTPGEVLTFRQRKAIGFLISEGGIDSHMALVARALFLPVVLVDNCWRKIPNHCKLIVDGTAGEIIVNPTDDEWNEYQKQKKRQGPARITRIRKLPHFPPITKDGKEVGVATNLSLPGPVDDVLAEQKIPVGLYRTEFLYLAKDNFPSEEEQFHDYFRIAEKFRETSVILRTFDLGFDKIASRKDWPSEDNPALGWRGIRPMLELSSLFKTQIRAMLRASTGGNIKIMLPMISDVSEVKKAKKLISQVKLALRRDGIAYDPDVEIGIMVETPSAALTVDKLIEHVDFMSIGTNDLTQYVLAVDRLNSHVAHLYNSLHPSVIRLVDMTVKACKKQGKMVSICGEVAGDLLALPLFIGMEIDQLSVIPGRVFDLCRMVSKIDSSLVKHLATSVVASKTLYEVIDKLENFNQALTKRRTLTKRI